MTFEIDFDEEPEVDWPVTINVPKDGGGVDPYKVTVRFKLLDSIKLKEFGVNTPAITVLEDHVTGWGDEFVDKKTGKKLKFCNENLLALLAKPWIQRSFSAGIVSASSGAEAKN